MAATSGNLKALQTLLSYLKKGLDINLNLQTIGGETPLIKAVMFCKPECVWLLLAEKDTKPMLETVEGKNAFKIAEKMGNIKINQIIEKYL
jgi:ankyrin repeat protein